MPPLPGDIAATFDVRRKTAKRPPRPKLRLWLPDRYREVRGMSTFWSLYFVALSWAPVIDLASAVIGVPAFLIARGYRKRRVGA
jgi:hypothetical protein